MFMDDQEQNNNMAARSGKTLMEKGQHLDPVRLGCVRSDGDSRGGADDYSAQGCRHADDCCEVNSVDIDGTYLVHEDATHSVLGDFKLGADSIDEPHYDAADGLLLPTSPTSPTSPCSLDGTGLKSSLRDPHRPKTPPGTPHRKSVRFADALGLDLETVKTILRTESPPDLPGLSVHVDEEQQTISAKVLALCFQQPGGKPNFIPRLYQLNVCLENVVVHEFTLIGTIKVRNLGYEKDVRIRHSADNWNSYVDVMGMYVLGSCDGPTDRFSFGLSAPRNLAPGGILSFAIYYKVAGKIYWDNNSGQNYSLVCEEVKKEGSKTS